MLCSISHMKSPWMFALFLDCVYCLLFHSSPLCFFSVSTSTWISFMLWLLGWFWYAKSPNWRPWNSCIRQIQIKISYLYSVSQQKNEQSHKVLPYFTMFSELNMVRYKILQTSLLQSCIFNILIDCSTDFSLRETNKSGSG